MSHKELLSPKQEIDVFKMEPKIIANAVQSLLYGEKVIDAEQVVACKQLESVTAAYNRLCDHEDAKNSLKVAACQSALQTVTYLKQHNASKEEIQAVMDFVQDTITGMR